MRSARCASAKCITNCNISEILAWNVALTILLRRESNNVARKRTRDISRIAQSYRAMVSRGLTPLRREIMQIRCFRDIRPKSSSAENEDTPLYAMGRTRAQCLKTDKIAHTWTFLNRPVPSRNFIEQKPGRGRRQVSPRSDWISGRIAPSCGK